MKKYLITVLAAFAVLLGVASPAAAVEPWQSDMTGIRFWTGAVCVDGSGINGPNYRVAYIAQQWNLKVNHTAFALNYEDDCAAAGYPPSRRFVVGTYSNPSDIDCLTATNTASSYYNGMYRWTSGPGIYINAALTGCVGSQAYRDHEVSSAIGFAMGLKTLQGNGWDSRVMCSCNRGIIDLPDPYSAARLRQIYYGTYGG